MYFCEYSNVAHGIKVYTVYSARVVVNRQMSVSFASLLPSCSKVAPFNIAFS